MIAIDCDTMFDGVNIYDNTSVLIDDENIVSIGKKGEFKSKIDKVIDCKFLMPGLIDMHVHIGGYKEGVISGNPFLPMKKFLKLLLYNGVTTVRDVGNSIETILYLKRWVEKYPAPYIYSSGPILDEPPLIWPHSRMIKTPEEAVFEINRLSIEGVDLLKIYKNVTEEILKVVIEQANAKDLKVAGHLENVDIKIAAQLGIHSLEHVFTLINESYIPDEMRDSLPNDFKKNLYIWKAVDLNTDSIKRLVEVLQKYNVFICPTILVFLRMSNIEEMFTAPNLEYMEKIMPYHKYFKYMKNPIAQLFSKKYIKKYFHTSFLKKQELPIFNEAIEKIFEFIKILVNNGVNIIAGSDTPNPSIVPGFSLHEELELFEKAGLSIIDILKSVTSKAAEALGENTIGLIKKGYKANLLLLKSNPLINKIKALNDIDKIILKGKVLTYKDRQKLLSQVLK